jgi:hypothetical protein
MGISSEFDVQWHSLSPQLRPGDHDTGVDPGDGFSAPMVSRQLRVWAPTTRGRRIRREPVGGPQRAVSVKLRTFSGRAVGVSVHSEDRSLDSPWAISGQPGLSPPERIPTIAGPIIGHMASASVALRPRQGELTAHVIATDTDTVYDVEE